MKIYTRTGDEGTTALFGGDRVSKEHPRIAAYGTVDETNALLGIALTQLDLGTPDLTQLIERLQDELFVLGADLATPLDSKPVVPRMRPDHVEHLERTIDALQEELPPLKHFILPGGTPAAATLHHARTVCRRAERLTVASASEQEVNEQALVYLNRLSDLLFVLARAANQRSGAAERTWQPPSDGGGSSQRS